MFLAVPKEFLHIIGKGKNSVVIENGPFGILFDNETYNVDYNDKKILIETKYNSAIYGTKYIIKKDRIEIFKNLNPSFNTYFSIKEDFFVVADNFKSIVDLIKKIKGKLHVTEKFIEIFKLRHLVAGETLFREIKRLKPFEKLVIFKKWGRYKLMISDFLTPTFTIKNNVITNIPEYFEEIFLNELNSVVTQILNSNKKRIAILLSGGIDSTLLVTLLKKYIEKNSVVGKGLEIITYTYPLSEDKENGRWVARILGIPNFIIKLKDSRSEMCKHFRQFVIENGYPIYHPGFFQLSWKKIKSDLILYNQGIEDITFGRPEFRVIKLIQQTKLFLLPSFILPKGKMRLLRDIIMSVRNSDPMLALLSVKSLIPLEIKSNVRDVVFLRENINSSNLSFLKKLGLLYIFNGFFLDTLNIDKIIFSPAISLSFIKKLLRIPENFLIRNKYDRYIERIILRKYRIPKDIFLRKERASWNEQTKDWFEKMRSYHQINIDKLFNLDVIPLNIEDWFKERIAKNDQKIVYFLSSLYEILKFID